MVTKFLNVILWTQNSGFYWVLSIWLVPTEDMYPKPKNFTSSENRNESGNKKLTSLLRYLLPETIVFYLQNM